MKKATAVLAALLLCTGLTACGSSTEDTAAVQSVSSICGYGPVGTAQQFAGVVTTRSQVEIEKQEEQTVEEIKVAEGDSVTTGQILFTYDGEAAQIELDKAELELEQLKNSLENSKEQKTSLEKEKAKASSDQQLSYSLEIQDVEADIVEEQYNISSKEKEISKMQEALENLDVKSTIDGVVTSINENDATDSNGNPQPFMVLSEIGNYRVKGYVNESNISVLSEGTAVIIRSRMDDNTWKGTISTIDFEDPLQNTSDYYSSNDTQQSSKYPFYVDMEDTEGLLLGQHVYIEQDLGQDDSTDAQVSIPSGYIEDTDSSPWVWAEAKGGKLEKRTLTLGDYDENLDTYVVLTGITLDDYIAWPDDSLKEGQTCAEYDGSAGGDISYEEGYDSNDYTDGDYYEGSEDYSDGSDYYTDGTEAYSEDYYLQDTEVWEEEYYSDTESGDAAESMDGAADGQ